jgi:Flp pilus assembly protein TadG
MVEFALILPVLLLVVCMGLETIALMVEHAATQRCATELARYAAICEGTPGAIEANVALYARSGTVDGCRAEAPGPEVAVAFANWPPGHTVTVTVTRKVDITLPIVAVFWPDGQFTATGQAQAWSAFELPE